MALVNKTFNQLIDFTRTTSATYVNSAGLIATTSASANLLTYTQEFDNAAWSKANATVTANSAIAPDGTATADTLTETTANNVHQAIQNVSVTSGATYTASVFVQNASGTRRLNIAFPATGFGTEIYATFNLSTLAIATSAGVTATISSLGNGWFRCQATATATLTASTQLVFRLASTDTASFQSYTGDGTSGLYLWGAQLEQASTASAYTRNYGGVYPPRFDYDPVTLAPKGLLIEEQRTNLLTYSSDFTNAVWSNANVTVTAAATTSPDGTANASKLAATAGAATGLYQSVAVAATSATVSVYVKQGTGATTANNFVLYNVTTATNLIAGTLNYSTGAWAYTTGSTGVTVSNAENGWWRVQITATSGITSGNTIRFYTGFAGAVQTAGDFLYAYGAQLEAGAFATSYIPTVASQVTRSADIAVIQAPNFAPWFNGTAGTFVVQADTFAPSGTRALAAPGSGSSALIYVTSSSFIGIYDGTNIVATANTVSPNTAFKGATAYSASGLAAVLNNGTVASGSYTGSFASVSSIYLGTNAVAGSINGHIRSIKYYPTQLTNAQLQALTT